MKAMFTGRNISMYRRPVSKINSPETLKDLRQISIWPLKIACEISNLPFASIVGAEKVLPTTQSGIRSGHIIYLKRIKLYV